ncbi:MAG: thioesterase family protein [Oscillospiraceae bacterium]|nr:thioesterase family protein [Oscillospiraceae bacterium]
MEIKTGASYTTETAVDKTNIASALGSGLVDVYATPMMIALMELAASECIKPFLEPGQVSVGGHVNVSHVAATPVGMKVSATATVSVADRRRVDFDVTMRDETGEIGSGTHTRFIVDKDKFTAKANEKLNH